MDTKVLIGIPTNRLIQPQMMLSLVNLVKNVKVPVDIILADKGYTIAENRNFLGISTLKGGYTHLLMLDDDMIFPPDTLDRLLAHDKDFVGVAAHSRTMPPMSMVTLFNQDEIPLADKLLGRQELPKELFKCKAVGGAVVLVKKAVFEKAEQPWFSNRVAKNGMNEQGEDYWFCEMVEKAGMDIWVDPTITIGHIGNYVY